MPEFMPHYDDDLYVNLQWAPEADVEVLVTGWDNPLRYTQVPEQWDALPGMGRSTPWSGPTATARAGCSPAGIGHGPEAVSHPSFRGLFARGASGRPPARSPSSCPRVRGARARRRLVAHDPGTDGPRHVRGAEAADVLGQEEGATL